MDFLTADNPIADTAVVKDYIDADLASDSKRKMSEGVRYFKLNHDILKRKMTYLQDDFPVEDKTKTNHRIAHGFHRLLVLQKTAYIVGNPIVFSIEGEDTGAKVFTKRLNELLGEQFDDKSNIWVQGACNKGKEWLHPYINEKGELKYVIIPAEQIIPIYDTAYEEELQSIIRYYSMTVVYGNKTKERYRVELWDSEKVTYFIQEDDDRYAFDTSVEPNPRYHWYSMNTAMPGVRKENTWGRIPFIALENNDEHMSDLEFTKTLIDDYDLNVSDFSNNLAEIQELIWVLRGYEGTNLNEFMMNLKTKKAIAVSAGEGSGADAVKADLPKDARDSHLDRMEENVFLFGMGVNMKTDQFGNSPTGVALKFMYQALDLNASLLIRKMKGSLKEFMYFVTHYINMKDGTSYDYTKVKFTFNKSMLTNTAETVEILKNSVGMISEETIVANHPLVDDASEEIKKLEKDKQRQQQIYNDEPGDDKPGGIGK